jgi:NAD(P)-dependent dehydrogenase (short-subunit alcohol dehydrogenase family)
VTGAASGFGRGTVEEFLRRGWHVFATDLDPAPLEELSQERLTTRAFDVRDPEARAATLDAVRAHGRLDCLVSNAGYGLYGALEDLQDEELRGAFETMVFGGAFLARDALPLLRERGGSLVFMSSAFGINGFPITSGYCAAKFALEGLAESLHYELAPHGVRVALVEPGAAVTGFGGRVVWGTRRSGAYRAQTAGLQAVKARIRAKGLDPTPQVASAVVSIAEHPRGGRLRHVVGLDAWAGVIFRRLLPEFLTLPLQRFMYRRLLGGPGDPVPAPPPDEPAAPGTMEASP